MRAMRVVYLVNLKFKDCSLVDTSADIHIAMHIHRYAYQLMGVFFDKLKLCSTAAPTARLAKTKADIANNSSHSCSSRCQGSTLHLQSDTLTNKL